MQETSVLLSLAAVFAVALISPGPDVALVVRTALYQGQRAGLLSALGLACGILLHGTLVLSGVALLLSRTEWLFGLVQVGGALYLGWLGIGAVKAWWQGGSGTLRLDSELVPSAFGPWLRGVLTNLCNPKALVFFLALLSSLVPADMSLPGKVACAGLLFGLSLFWFGLLGMTFSRPLMRQRLLQVAPTIDFLCGLMFLLVAVSIVGRLLL
ncbi:LysE family translocator [Pseudomonas sp. ALS1131]|nr:LysE family transporter [Pseudomonas sp. ALS1131]TRO40830.1 LysE family translocator [Pseudomonas sp. ALS1131]